MAIDKISTSARFEEPTLKKLAHVAKVNKRSFNAQLEFLAEQCIEQFEKEKGEIIINGDE